MADSILTRLKNAWNIFRYGENKPFRYDYTYGGGYSTRPDRPRYNYGIERSIIAAIYTRIGIDVAAIPMYHVRLDKDKRFSEIIESGLNNCLTLEANLDQSGRAFIQDVVMSMCDEGVVAIVPTDTTINPVTSSSYDILTMRTGKIIRWYPEYVTVNLYNQISGQKEDLTIPKTNIAIIENPLYAVMNEPNSTLQRLITKLNLLDVIDQQSGSGKLDIILQVPYVIKTDARKKQAEQRRADIDAQLKDSKYGIAYTDGTEKITQLNRPAENNLMGQIEYLTSMLYSQLGLAKEIFDGVADEKQMLNYYNRTVEPMLSAIVDGMKRAFLTKTARSQGQTIMFIRDPFRLVPVESLADIADKFTRNEIMSSNEIRGIVGFKPSNDPKADELRNKNLNEAEPDSNKLEEPLKKLDKEMIKTGQNGRSKYVEN